MKRPWMQFIILLAVTFVFVPFVIENSIYQVLIQLGFSDLIAGNIVGLLIGIILITAGYLTLNSNKSEAWKQAGVRLFDRSHFPLLLKLSILSFIVSVLSYLISVGLGADVQNEKADAISQSLEFFPLLTAFVGAVIISPLYEEIFYRGMMLSILKRIVSDRLALFLQALIFSMAHVPNWNILLLAFVNGYIFAYAYRKTGSVFASAFVHGVVNALILAVTIPLIG